LESDGCTRDAQHLVVGSANQIVELLEGVLRRQSTASL